MKVNLTSHLTCVVLLRNDGSVREAILDRIAGKLFVTGDGNCESQNYVTSRTSTRKQDL